MMEKSICSELLPIGKESVFCISLYHRSYPFDFFWELHLWWKIQSLPPLFDIDSQNDATFFHVPHDPFVKYTFNFHDLFAAQARANKKELVVQGI